MLPIGVERICAFNEVITLLTKRSNLVRNTVKVDGRTIRVTEFTRNVPSERSFRYNDLLRCKSLNGYILPLRFLISP